MALIILVVIASIVVFGLVVIAIVVFCLVSSSLDDMNIIPGKYGPILKRYEGEYKERVPDLMEVLCIMYDVHTSLVKGNLNAAIHYNGEMRTSKARRGLSEISTSKLEKIIKHHPNDDKARDYLRKVKSLNEVTKITCDLADGVGENMGKQVELRRTILNDFPYPLDHGDGRGEFFAVGLLKHHNISNTL